ncbi:MAG TPA: prenyltransferase/squalene oxidase repeat-containing protein [Planctomycetota bacterium]|nr:prenyltransferase/squalene oxidase repeat-containing protein [Planctomycetota bacterium]
MRRSWPIGFLISFLLIFTFRPESSPQPGRRCQVPAATQEGAPPDSAELATGPSPTPPAAPVEPQIEETQPRARSAVLAGLLWALRHQNEDGSWGDAPTTLGDRTIGRTGVTGFVLLALLGAGYSHLSRDEYDGIVVGPRVKKGISWLLTQLREDGLFLSGYDDRFDQAIAALALSDSYGMTASTWLKEPTARALDALTRLQAADGSWGGSAATPWAILALVSGENNELPYPNETRDRAFAYLRTQPHAAQLEAREFLKDRSDPDALEGLAQAIANSPPHADETDFEALYHQATGLFLYDGPEGVLWKKWAPAARDALIPAQNPDGSWNGGSESHRLVRTALAEFTLQTCYRYGGSLTLGR